MIIVEYFRESLLSGDIGPPTSGMFLFNDNQGGQREIFVRVLAASENQEVEEHFALILTDADPAEISQEKGNVTITVLKKVSTLKKISVDQKFLHVNVVYL